MFGQLKKNLIVAAATTAFACASLGVAQADDTLQNIKDRGFVRIAVANEIPYGYVDANGDAKGAGPDVAKAVLKSMGIDEIQWVVTGFSSLIPGLKANRFDMAAAEMAVLPQRCKQIDYSTPNTTYGEGLLVQKGNPKDVTSYDQFSKDNDLKVAIMAGADQLDMLQDLGVPQGKMVMINNNADAISTVATGRADAYAATGMTAAQLADKSDRVQIVQNFKDPVINGQEVRSWGAFAFNKNADSFREAFNKAFEKYKKTDEWRKTLRSYGWTKHDIDKSFDKTTKQLCSESSQK
ncbi:MAG TPA: ectoine/hydroxyectoine ABC transporter substrate-binding protein EhuB [Gammaproteobacteria bacterium]|nr:ectoine/hydroxyectoine ABC transporter substrate-binding protein EhuB [Gammaproteobacteria bacterium]